MLFSRKFGIIWKTFQFFIFFSLMNQITEIFSYNLSIFLHHFLSPHSLLRDYKQGMLIETNINYIRYLLWLILALIKLY